jgi:hypothetical protein
MSSARPIASWREAGSCTDGPRVPAGPVPGPDGTAAVIKIEQTGAWWLRWWRGSPAGIGWGGLPGLVLWAALMACLLITEVIWRYVFHRAYTVHVRTTGQPAIKTSARLPSEVAACQSAARLATRFQAEGPAALRDQSWAAAPPPPAPQNANTADDG